MYREKIFSGREDYEEENMYTATRVTIPRTQLETFGCGGGRSPEAVNWLAKPRGGVVKNNLWAEQGSMNKKIR